MIDIVSEKGELYRFDPDTGRIFKDNVLMSSLKVEPVYSDPFNKTLPPRFSGILFKETNQLLTLSGKINPVVDPNVVL